MTIQRAQHDIEIYRGDTPKFTYQLAHVNNDTGEELPVDISLLDITAQVRRNMDDTAIWYSFPIKKVDTANGIFSWQITKEDSENLLPPNSTGTNTAVYDIQLSVDGSDVYTFMHGQFSVVRDITRGGY